MGERIVRLTRRRLLGGFVILGSASGAIGAGTMAYFSDSEESAGNIVQAGTLNLGFDGSETFELSTALAPTQTTDDDITLVNNGSVSGSLAVDVTYGPNESTESSEDVSVDDVAENLEVRRLEYVNGNDRLEPANLENPTLRELSEHAESTDSRDHDLEGLPDPGSDGSVFLIELYLRDVGDEYQGMGVSIEFEFTLTQTTDQ